MGDIVADRREIRELVENWVVWRDAGDWERFRTVWHEDGVMMATWFQGSRDEFIRVSREGWDKGVNILHFLGGHSADIAGPRAVSQTKMTISQRAIVEGVACDVVCTGRFYDFLEKRDGRWGMVLRQPIYEKDRIDAIDPMAELRLDPELLAERAKRYGMTIEQYKRRNLMGVEITSAGVGNLVATMLGSDFGATTGAHVTIDGGNERTI